jgi:hypothetical protein
MSTPAIFFTSSPPRRWAVRGCWRELIALLKMKHGKYAEALRRRVGVEDEDVRRAGDEADGDEIGFLGKEAMH